MWYALHTFVQSVNIFCIYICDWYTEVAEACNFQISFMTGQPKFTINGALYLKTMISLKGTASEEQKSNPLIWTYLKCTLEQRHNIHTDDIEFLFPCSSETSACNGVFIRQNSVLDRKTGSPRQHASLQCSLLHYSVSLDLMIQGAIDGVWYPWVKTKWQTGVKNCLTVELL